MITGISAETLSKIIIWIVSALFILFCVGINIYIILSLRKIKALMRVIETQNLEISKLRWEIDKLTADLKKQKDLLDMTREVYAGHINDLKRELSALKEMISKKDSEIEELKNRIRKLEAGGKN